ncbi:MAG: 50S ribosomal protein L11 methyltransferase [Flavobacteriales bacterium]|nr:50S ribosomal protein L11 methyltransferase [Flavobacteriales bacterium]
MIEELLKLNVKEQDVLDMGCGTSVLAILASKLGARRVLAIDNDEWSVNNSVENLKLNNIDNVSVKQGSDELLHRGHFNLILANINLNVLLSQINTYVDVLCEGGSIMFSGVLELDVHKLIASIENVDLVVKETKQKDKWVMIRCVK